MQNNISKRLKDHIRRKLVSGVKIFTSNVALNRNDHIRSWCLVPPERECSAIDCISNYVIQYQAEPPQPQPKERMVKRKEGSSREQKAARTMAVIVVTFVVCWLPFFTMYVTLPFCSSCGPPPAMVR